MEGGKNGSSARVTERRALSDYNARSSFGKELNLLKVNRSEMDAVRVSLQESERQRKAMERDFASRLAKVEAAAAAQNGMEQRLARMEARLDEAFRKLEGKASRSSVASALHKKAGRKAVESELQRLTSSVEEAVAAAAATQEATRESAAAAERAAERAAASSDIVTG